MKEQLYEAIVAANQRLHPYVRRTPMVSSHDLSQRCGNQVHLKLENLQMTGAFKLRGALNKLFSLPEDALRAGVICASAGNHAQGVAYGASLLGVPATIVMPATTPHVKVSATEGFGARVLLEGNSFEAAAQKAEAMSTELGLTMVHPYDDWEVIAGQGTLGLEILDQLPDCDTVLVPVGGGGLLAGIAAAIKAKNPRVQVLGVEPLGAASMFMSFYKNQRASLEKVETKAEGAAVKTPGKHPFSVVRALCDGVLVVSEEAIAEAVWDLMHRDKIVTEYAGALSVAALRALQPEGRRVVCLVSGGNIDAMRLHHVVSEANLIPYEALRRSNHVQAL